MTSTVKTDLTLNTSLLVDEQAADAGDVLAALTDALTHLRSGRLGVTANDTHVKHLDDAFTVSADFVKTIVNAGGNEAVLLTLAMVSAAKGGLGANAAAFSGLLKMAAGVASVATPNTDYVAPTGAGSIAGKTLDGTNTIHLAALATGAAPTNYVLAPDGAGGTTTRAEGGGGAQPIDLLLFTAGETLAERDAVYLNSSYQWRKIDTNASPLACGEMRGMVNEAGGITSGNAGSVRILGEVSGFTGLTAGAKVYASTTAGGYTQTRPTVSAGGGQVASVTLGLATSTTAVMVLNTYRAEYLKRESLANAASLTIQHHSDPQGRSRRVRGYVMGIGAGVTAATYASANQDTHQALSTKSVATYTADQCVGGTGSANSEIVPASNAFDNNLATEWSGSGGVTQIKYVFPTAKTIRRYTIASLPGYGSHAPAAWTLEGSSDGSSWTVYDTRSAQTGWNAAGETRTYTVAAHTASITQWRLNITAINGGVNTTITEIEMLAAATYTDGATKLAQSFQVTGTPIIDQVKLWLKKVGSPTGTLTLRIETDNAGSPSGTLVDANATVTLAESGLGTSYAWATFDFPVNFSLSGSTTYWLVLSTSRGTDELHYVHWGTDASSPGYASGSFSTFSGSWAGASQDACFEVIAQGATFDEPCVIGRSSGGTRDLGVRFDDGSGSNGDTHTYFTNVSGGTLDVTCLVEV